MLLRALKKTGMAGAFIALTTLPSFANDSKFETIKPSDMYYGHALWEHKSIEVKLIGDCYINKRDLFRSISSCTTGIYLNPKSNSDKKLTRFNQKETATATLTLDGTTITSEQWINQTRGLAKQFAELGKDPVVTVKINSGYPDYEKAEYTILLADYEKTYKEVESGAREWGKHEANEHNSKVVMAILAFLAFLYGTYWFIRNKVVPKAKESKTKLQVKAATLAAERKAKEDNERVRRIAEEEVVREAVRRTVVDAKDEDIDTIKERIKTALDNGDTQEATTLMTMLSAKEGDSSEGKKLDS